MDQLNNNEFNISKRTKQQVRNETTHLIEDVENGEVPKNRLKQFHQYLQDSIPEMQLTATASAINTADNTAINTANSTVVRTAKDIEKMIRARNKKKPSVEKFQDRTEKVTLYLEKDVKNLLYIDAEGEKGGVTALLNHILKEYYGLK